MAHWFLHSSIKQKTYKSQSEPSSQSPGKSLEIHGEGNALEWLSRIHAAASRVRQHWETVSGHKLIKTVWWHTNPHKCLAISKFSTYQVLWVFFCPICHRHDVFLALHASKIQILQQASIVGRGWIEVRKHSRAFRSEKVPQEPRQLLSSNVFPGLSGKPTSL